MDCNSVFHKTVCMEAKVTLTPDVDIGALRAFCVDDPKVIRCMGDPQHSCSFFLNQLVCVQIPLTFTASGTAKAEGIVCNPPIHEPCKEKRQDCDEPHKTYIYPRKPARKPVKQHTLLPCRNDYIEPKRDTAVYYRYHTSDEPSHMIYQEG